MAKHSDRLTAAIEDRHNRAVVNAARPVKEKKGKA